MIKINHTMLIFKEKFSYFVFFFKKKMSLKRKYDESDDNCYCTLFDCSVFDIDVLLHLVFGFLHNMQLEYWINQSRKEPEIEMLVRHARSLQPNTLLNLMQVNLSPMLIEEAHAKIEWSQNSVADYCDIFLEHAPMWWLTKYVKNDIVPKSLYDNLDHFDDGRLQELCDTLCVDLWSKPDQANLFVQACYRFDVSLIDWLWDKLSLAGHKLKVAFGHVNTRDVYRFLNAWCWCSDIPNSGLPPYLDVELLKIKWDGPMPSVMEALKAKNLEVAKYVWPTTGAQCFKQV